MLDGGNPVEVFTIEGDGSYVDAGTNTSLGSYTTGVKVIGCGGEATAHPFDVTFPVHTDIYQHISARFGALAIGHAAINSYEYGDNRDKRGEAWRARQHRISSLCYALDSEARGHVSGSMGFLRK